MFTEKMDETRSPSPEKEVVIVKTRCDVDRVVDAYEFANRDWQKSICLDARCDKVRVIFQRICLNFGFQDMSRDQVQNAMKYAERVEISFFLQSHSYDEYEYKLRYVLDKIDREFVERRQHMRKKMNAATTNDKIDNLTDILSRIGID